MDATDYGMLLIYIGQRVSGIPLTDRTPTKHRHNEDGRARYEGAIRLDTSRNCTAFQSSVCRRSYMGAGVDATVVKSKGVVLQKLFELPTGCHHGQVQHKQTVFQADLFLLNASIHTMPNKRPHKHHALAGFYFAFPVTALERILVDFAAS
jgi:hypothetical protein